MKEEWFKARTPEEGQGYKVAGTGGWLMIAALTILVVAILWFPSFVLGVGIAPLIISAVSFFVVVGAFMMIVRRTSDWQG